MNILGSVRRRMGRASACVALGIGLLVFGVSATPSFSYDISRFFTGSPTDKAVWMILAGLVLCLVGLLDALHRMHRDWFDKLNSPLAFLVITLSAGLLSFTSPASLTTSIAEVLFVISLVLFLASLLQTRR